MFCPSCKKLMRPKPSQGIWVCQKCRTTVRIQDSGTEKQQGIDTPTMTRFQYRPGQEEFRKEILEEVMKGTRVVLLEAPVGAGKSLILSEVAQALHRDHRWSGYYTTPQVNLVDQLRADPLVNDKIQPITGMDNYTCPIDPVPEKLKRRVSEAWCIHGKPCDHCRGRGSIGGKEKPVKCTVCQGKGTTTFKCSERYKSCEYFLDRRRAARGPLATMTMAYLLRVTRGTSVPQAAPMVTPVDVEEPPKFLQRDFLIVDEAHGIGDYARTLSIKLSECLLDGPAWKAFWASDLEELVKPSDDHFRNASSEEVRSIVAQVQEGVQKVLEAEQSTAEEDSDSKEGLRRIRRHNRAQMLKDELDAAMEDLDAGNPWVAQKREDDETSYLEVTPVLSQKLLSRRLWPLGSKLVILSTGTILDPRRFLWEAGLPEEGFKHLRPPSSFPAENAPIFTRPSVNLTYRNQEQNLPVALRYLQEIMDRHPGQRGLIHTVSYRMQRQIYDSLPERYRARVVIHDRGGDRNRTLGNWKKDTSRGTVLLSVAMEEGLDLKGEMAEWQAILKCPWDNTKDRRNEVRRGMQDGRQWYELQALRKLLQSFGRIVRSETDVGWTYILDSSALGLLNDYWDMLPPWAQDRLTAGKRVAEQGFEVPAASKVTG